MSLASSQKSRFVSILVLTGVLFNFFWRIASISVNGNNSTHLLLICCGDEMTYVLVFWSCYSKPQTLQLNATYPLAPAPILWHWQLNSSMCMLGSCRTNQLQLKLQQQVLLSNNSLLQSSSRDLHRLKSSFWQGLELSGNSEEDSVFFFFFFLASLSCPHPWFIIFTLCFQSQRPFIFMASLPWIIAPSLLRKSLFWKDLES